MQAGHGKNTVIWTAVPVHSAATLSTLMKHSISTKVKHWMINLLTESFDSVRFFQRIFFGIMTGKSVENQQSSIGGIRHHPNYTIVWGRLFEMSSTIYTVTYVCVRNALNINYWLSICWSTLSVDSMFAVSIFLLLETSYELHLFCLAFKLFIGWMLHLNR